MSRAGSNLVSNDHHLLIRCVRNNHSRPDFPFECWSDENDRKSCAVADDAPSRDWTDGSRVDSMACEMGRLAARCVFVILGRCAGCRVAINLECEDFLLHSDNVHYNALDWSSAPFRSRRMFLTSGAVDRQRESGPKE